MNLTELKQRLARGVVDEAEVHSVEGVIYFVRIDDETLTTSRDARPLQFRSVHAASLALGKLGLDRGWLVHASPYDEMIGRPDETLPPPAPLRTPLSFPRAS